jgi:hypothetical protein
MEYTVEQHDCLSSLGEKFGIPWEIIWNHSENAALKQKRKNPHVIFPGDKIFIPEIEIKEEIGATEKKHKFKKKSEKVLLRLRLLEEDVPRKNLKYTLVVNDQNIEGTTDGDGKLEQKIPASATEAWIKTKEDVYHLKLGGLDPVEEDSGIEQRLKNLSFLGNEANAEAIAAAIKAFQEKHGLSATGNIDEAVRNKLRDIHGS